MDELASLIHEDLKCCQGSRDEWILGVICLCEHFAQARKAIPGDAEFGQWADAQNFVWNNKPMNKDERWAAVNLGQQDAEALRNHISTSDTISLEILWRSLNDTDYNKKKRSRKNPSAKKKRAKSKSSSKSTQTSAQWKARLKEVYEKKCTKFRAKVDREYQAKENAWRKQYEKDWERARLTMASSHGLISQKEAVVIMRALHPDHVNTLAEHWIKTHNEAMLIWNKYKDKLVKQDGVPYTPPPFTTKSRYSHGWTEERDT